MSGKEMYNAVIDNAFYDALWKKKKSEWVRDEDALNWINSDVCKFYCMITSTGIKRLKRYSNMGLEDQLAERNKIIKYLEGREYGRQYVRIYKRLTDDKPRLNIHRKVQTKGKNRRWHYNTSRTARARAKVSDLGKDIKNKRGGVFRRIHEYLKKQVKGGDVCSVPSRTSNTRANK